MPAAAIGPRDFRHSDPATHGPAPERRLPQLLPAAAEVIEAICEPAGGDRRDGQHDMRVVLGAVSEGGDQVGAEVHPPVGDVVRLQRPADADEAAARFDVIELRGDRVLIRLKCNLPLPPMEAVMLGDVERC